MFPLKDNIPTERFPVVTVALILANTLMYFLFQKGGILSGPDDCKVVGYGAIPFEITHPGDQVIPKGALEKCSRDVLLNPTWVTVFTGMFMHGSLLHIAGNMLFLWIFGNNVEDSMGRLKFLAFYLLGGVVALATQTIVDPNSPVPTVGASGAVAAVLGAYLLLFPHARVITVIFIVFFFTILEIPAVFVLGFWFLQQVLFGYFQYANPAGGGGGGVAYFAHIGGFVFGLAIVKLLARPREPEEPLF